MLLAPALLMHGGKKHHENLKKSLATLDIGSHSNAGCQAPPIAGATEEHRLLAVACTPLILIEAPSSAYRRGMLARGTQPPQEAETSGDSTLRHTSFLVGATGMPAPWLSAS
jgi:hypothetical protein